MPWLVGRGLDLGDLDEPRRVLAGDIHGSLRERRIGALDRADLAAHRDAEQRVGDPDHGARREVELDDALVVDVCPGGRGVADEEALGAPLDRAVLARHRRAVDGHVAARGAAEHDLARVDHAAVEHEPRLRAEILCAAGRDRRVDRVALLRGRHAAEQARLEHVHADRDEVSRLERRALEDPRAVDVRAGLRPEVGRDELIPTLRDRAVDRADEHVGHHERAVRARAEDDLRVTQRDLLALGGAGDEHELAHRIGRGGVQHTDARVAAHPQHGVFVLVRGRDGEPDRRAAEDQLVAVGQHAAIGAGAVELGRRLCVRAEAERRRRDHDVLLGDAGILDDEIAVVAAADAHGAVDEQLASRGRPGDDDQLDLGLRGDELDPAEVEPVAVRQHVDGGAAADGGDRIAVELRRPAAEDLDRVAAAHRALDHGVPARDLGVGQQDVVRLRVAAEAQRLRGRHDVDARECSGLE